MISFLTKSNLFLYLSAIALGGLALALILGSDPEKDVAEINNTYLCEIKSKRINTGERSLDRLMGGINSLKVDITDEHLTIILADTIHKNRWVYSSDPKIRPVDDMSYNYEIISNMIVGYKDSPYESDINITQLIQDDQDGKDAIAVNVLTGIGDKAGLAYIIFAKVENETENTVGLRLVCDIPETSQEIQSNES